METKDKPAKPTEPSQDSDHQDATRAACFVYSMLKELPRDDQVNRFVEFFRSITTAENPEALTSAAREAAEKLGILPDIEKSLKQPH